MKRTTRTTTSRRVFRAPPRYRGPDRIKTLISQPFSTTGYTYGSGFCIGSHRSRAHPPSHFAQWNTTVRVLPAAVTFIRDVAAAIGRLASVTAGERVPISCGIPQRCSRGRRVISTGTGRDRGNTRRRRRITGAPPGRSGERATTSAIISRDYWYR